MTNLDLVNKRSLTTAVTKLSLGCFFFLGQYNRNVVGLGQRDPVTGHGITLPLIPQFQLAANNLKEFYENPANDEKLSRGCMRQYMNHKKILPSLPAGHIYFEG